jgi:Flp pilus assembly pilin Flp
MPLWRILVEAWNDQAGVTAIEYAIVTALISVVGLSLYSQISGELSAVFTSAANSL